MSECARLECRCSDRSLLTSAGACFSDSRDHRYLLWRTWSPGQHLVVIMLNPSIADEQELDPKLRRVYGYAKAWGFGGMRILNAFSLVATKPADLIAAPRERRSDRFTDWHIAAELLSPATTRVMVGWGANMCRPQLSYRRSEIRALLQVARTRLYAWQIAKSGEPKHPLYLAADIEPVPYLP